MDTVFDIFEEIPYQFLEISRGGVYGNRIVAVHDAYGVFKRRNDMVQVNNQELRQSASTLHIHPEEVFFGNIMVDGKLQFVGHGVRVDGVNYEIVGDTEGKNFDDGAIEHYTLTLQTADYSEYAESS